MSGKNIRLLVESKDGRKEAEEFFFYTLQAAQQVADELTRRESVKTTITEVTTND